MQSSGGVRSTTRNLGKGRSPETDLRGGRNLDPTKASDEVNLGVLRKVVHSFYGRNEAPAVQKWEETLNDSYDSYDMYLSTGSGPGTPILVRTKILFSIVASTCSRSEAFVNKGYLFTALTKQALTQGTKTRVWEDTAAGYSSQTRGSELTIGIKQSGAKGERVIITHCRKETGFRVAQIY